MTLPTFSMVIDSHTWIDRTTWDPHRTPPAEAPSQAEYPGQRMLIARLRDNGGSATPSHAEMKAFSRGVWGSRLVEVGSNRSWYTTGGGWNTVPPKTWPPDMSKPAEPANDTLMVHVYPWRPDVDYVQYPCIGGCKGNLTMLRSKATGVEEPLRMDDKDLRPWTRHATGWKCESCEHDLWSDVARRNLGMAPR